jgi:flagellar biosynthesis protein FliP
MDIDLKPYIDKVYNQVRDSFKDKKISITEVAFIVKEVIKLVEAVTQKELKSGMGEYKKEIALNVLNLLIDDFTSDDEQRKLWKNAVTLIIPAFIDVIVAIEKRSVPWLKKLCKCF